MSHKKFGPDRFSRFDVYWIQTDRQAKFIYRWKGRSIVKICDPLLSLSQTISYLLQKNLDVYFDRWPVYLYRKERQENDITDETNNICIPCDYLYLNQNHQIKA